MDLSKIKSNAMYEVEVHQKKVLKKKALSQYMSNLQSIKFKAQAEAILEHLKMAEYDSNYLRITFSNHANYFSKYNLFFVDALEFEKSEEFKNMLEILKKQGFKWRVDYGHDGGGMYSWSEYIFEVI